MKALSEEYKFPYFPRETEKTPLHLLSPSYEEKKEESEESLFFEKDNEDFYCFPQRTIEDLNFPSPSISVQGNNSSRGHIHQKATTFDELLLSSFPKKNQNIQQNKIVVGENNKVTKIVREKRRLNKKISKKKKRDDSASSEKPKAPKSNSGSSVALKSKINKEEGSTVIQSPELSDDTITVIKVTEKFFKNPKTTNFSIKKIRKLAKSFNFSYGKEDKIGTPFIKKGRKEVGKQLSGGEVAKLLNKIYRCSKNINKSAVKSCFNIQRSIGKMEDRANFRKKRQKRKPEKPKL